MLFPLTMCPSAREKVKSRDISDIETDGVKNYYSLSKAKRSVKYKRLRNRESSDSDGAIHLLGELPARLGLTHRAPPHTLPTRLLVYEHGYVWIDYCCAPQAKDKDGKPSPDLAKAISSITSYVDLSTFFIALCPEVLHQELKTGLGYGTYLARGWCRLEILSSLLSRYSGYEILVKQGSVE